jgi:hypothetical protein
MGSVDPKVRGRGTLAAYSLSMVFWAVVSYEINHVIEWFPTRAEAQKMLDTVVADEPEWRWIMCVEPIVLATGGAN